jgi:hypothetical protein
VIEDEVRREIADVVATHAIGDETHFFEVAALRNLLAAEVLKDPVQVAVKGASEIHTEPRAGISDNGEPQPILLDLGKAVPGVEQAIAHAASAGTIPQKHEVLNDALVESLIFRLIAVEQKERVDEERQIIDQGNIEGAELIHGIVIDIEEI